MAQTVTLGLSDETLQRYQRGATAAHKQLAECLAERLMDAVPPLPDDLPSPLREALREIERLDDAALWQIAQSQLPPARQRLHSRLLAKQSHRPLTARETDLLRGIGAEARLLTLKKAHAYMLLRWRGHTLPSLAALSQPG